MGQGIDVVCMCVLVCPLAITQTRGCLLSLCDDLMCASLWQERCRRQNSLSSLLVAVVAVRADSTDTQASKQAGTLRLSHRRSLT